MRKHKLKALSFKRMYCRSAISRGNGQETSESHGRSGEGYIHGMKAVIERSGQRLKASLQEWDMRNTASIEESVRHSDIVYNLVGRDYPTK